MLLELGLLASALFFMVALNTASLCVFLRPLLRELVESRKHVARETSKEREALLGEIHYLVKHVSAHDLHAYSTIQQTDHAVSGPLLPPEQPAETIQEATIRAEDLERQLDQFSGQLSGMPD